MINILLDSDDDFRSGCRNVRYSLNVTSNSSSQAYTHQIIIHRLIIRFLFIFIKNWITVQHNSRDLIGLAVMVYEPLYHTREIATIKLSSS